MENNTDITTQYKYTPKEALFCKEYIVDFNGTQAYMRAGYKASAKVARVNASKLLTKPNIEAKIKELMEERSKRTEITADMVLKEIANVAFLDVAEFYDEKGVMKAPHEMQEKARRAIASVTTKQETVGRGEKKEFYEIRTIRTNSKMHALELLGKHLGMFKQEIDFGDIIFSCVLPKELEK